MAGYRYAFALAANKQDAEDLLHDAWLRLVARYGNSPDKPLLFRTIKNIFVDGIRHSRVVADYVQRERQYSEPQHAEFEQLVMAELLDHHLVKLKPNEREILFLSVVEGYTADEIGVMTGQVRGTILSLLSRTKKKLRESMNRELDSELPDHRQRKAPSGGTGTKNVVALKGKRGN